MEGLLIAQELDRLRPLLTGPRKGWRFPDPHTFVLPFGPSALWLFNRPPNPRLEVRSDIPPGSGTHSGFQDLLIARASGEVREARQPKLDRVAILEFSGHQGFVETAPVTLVFELTGRNCNLILLDEEGRILGAAREIPAELNRYRQIAAGRLYTPPPPYEKLDPRNASRAKLSEELQGQMLRELPRLVDGVGPQLLRALSAHTGIARDDRLEGESLAGLLAALSELLEDPAGFVEASLGLPDVATVRAREQRQELLERLTSHLRREHDLLGKRLNDLERTRQAAEGANDFRTRAQLLLANSHALQPGIDEAVLSDFAGEEVTVPLDPRKSATENAQELFSRARKRETRAEQAAQREPELRKRREELGALLDRLNDLPTAELRELSAELLPERQTRRSRTTGTRFQGPHGFDVLIGRSARENDELTFKVARSRDVWLHVQGYHGSHVIIQARNREVPFETILFAAELAAGHSKASESDNVPVDYTLRKNVWKVKGQPPGAVNFTQQKTVYVTPRRSPERERR